MEEIKLWCLEEKLDIISFLSSILRSELHEAGHRSAAKAIENILRSLDDEVEEVEHFNPEETLSVKVNVGLSTNQMQRLSMSIKEKTGM